MASHEHGVDGIVWSGFGRAWLDFRHKGNNQKQTIRGVGRKARPLFVFDALRRAWLHTSQVRWVDKPDNVVEKPTRPRKTVKEELV